MSSDVKLNRLWIVEEVQVRVSRPQILGHPCPLVVARHNTNGHPRRGDIEQGRQGKINQRRRWTTPMEYIATMHHKIDLTAQRGLTLV